MSQIATHSLDRCMADAWPPVESVPLGPWTLRASEGVKRRANSVQTSTADGDSQLHEPSALARLIDAAEKFYIDRGLPPVFQVSDGTPPSRALSELPARGYLASASTDIVAVTLDTQSPSVAPSGPLAVRLSMSSQPSEAWFDFHQRIDNRMRSATQVSIVRDVLFRPPHPTVFAALSDGSDIVSVGQVVIVQGLACVQALGTAPKVRGQGVASVLVGHLTAEATRLGAHTAFAAVAEDNSASQRVFSRAGFTRSHGYRYFATAATIRSASPAGRPG